MVPQPLAVAKFDIVWGEETGGWWTKGVADEIPLLHGRILDLCRYKMDGVFLRGKHDNNR